MTHSVSTRFHQLPHWGHSSFSCASREKQLGAFLPSVPKSRHLARASLPVELRIHCVKLRTLEKCNSSSSVLFLLWFAPAFAGTHIFILTFETPLSQFSFDSSTHTRSLNLSHGNWNTACFADTVGAAESRDHPGRQRFVAEIQATKPAASNRESTRFTQETKVGWWPTDICGCLSWTRNRLDGAWPSTQTSPANWCWGSKRFSACAIDTGCSQGLWPGEEELHNSEPEQKADL